MFNEACKKITSLQNPQIGHWKCLRLESKYREEQGRVVVFGKKVVLDLLKHLSPLSLIVSENTPLPSTPAPIYLVTAPIMERISGLSSGIEMGAEFLLPLPTSLKQKKLILALDGIQDPGNLGTLVRTALSLEWEGLFFLSQGCDLFNDKVVRASRAGSLLIPYTSGTYEDLISLGLKVYIAHTTGRDIATMSPIKEGVLLLSNESQGVKERVKSLGEEVTIPISKKMESLNVAIAGAILMYQLKATS